METGLEGSVDGWMEGSAIGSCLTAILCVCAVEEGADGAGLVEGTAAEAEAEAEAGAEAEADTGIFADRERDTGTGTGTGMGTEGCRETFEADVETEFCSNFIFVCAGLHENQTSNENGLQWVRSLFFALYILKNRTHYLTTTMRGIFICKGCSSIFGFATSLVAGVVVGIF